MSKVMPFNENMLSIITPVKNAAPWLEACIQSGQNQNFTNWEWIWVDDHSTDNSFGLLRALAEKDNRIRIFRNPGKGIVSALQKGLEEASGNFITRMDADDLMPENRLEKMVSTLERSSRKTVVTGLVKYFSEVEISDGYKLYEKWLNTIALKNGHWKNVYRECVVASPNWMMRTEELQSTGGFSGLKYPEDYDLVFRWYANGFTIQTIPELTLLWREHARRTSRNSANYGQQKFFELKLKRFLELDFKGENLLVWGTGVKGRLTAKILNHLKVPFRWMDLKPEKFPIGLEGQPILSFRKIEQMENLKLLVAVYPVKNELEQIRAYLSKLGLEPGRDYWFL